MGSGIHSFNPERGRIMLMQGLKEELQSLLPDKNIAIENFRTSSNSIETAVFINNRRYTIDRIVPCNYSTSKAAAIIAKLYLKEA